MLSERQEERLETALTSDKHNLNMQLCSGQRAQSLCAVNSHQCQKASARCSLDVDEQLLTVIDSSENPLPPSDVSRGRAAKQLNDRRPEVVLSVCLDVSFVTLNRP